MSSCKRPRSPSASSIDPSTSKVPRTTTCSLGHSQEGKDHMLVNDSTSPPSYISVGQTRLKVHDGTNNEVRSRISRDASVMSKDQIQHLILELAGCNPNPEQMIALIESRRRRGFPAIEVCREIYIWLDVDDYWQRDHAYAKTLEQCYCKIESSVNGVMDEVLELMLNEMTDYQVAFDIWLEAATQLMRLVRRLLFMGEKRKPRNSDEM